MAVSYEARKRLVKAIIKLVISLSMLIVGMWMLIQFDWRVAVGVFLLIWAENINQATARENLRRELWR